MDPFISLSRAQNVIIDQKSNTLESCFKCFGCCCADFTNSYEIIVQDDGSNAHFTAKEDSSCIGRACCNPNHGLVLHVTDKSNNEVLTIDRPFKCCCFAVGPCQKSITIQKGTQTIGFVQQPCCGGCFTLNLYNSPGGKEIGKIKGPTCCIAGCCGSDFDVKSPDGNADLAEIRRGGVKSRGVASLPCRVRCCVVAEEIAKKQIPG